MHSQTRPEGNRAAFPTAVDHVGRPGLDARGRHGRNEAAWTGLPDGEVEVVN